MDSGIVVAMFVVIMVFAVFLAYDTFGVLTYFTSNSRKCRVCGKDFPDARDLKLHMKEHKLREVEMDNKEATPEIKKEEIEEEKKEDYPKVS